MRTKKIFITVVGLLIGGIAFSQTTTTKTNTDSTKTSTTPSTHQLKRKIIKVSPDKINVSKMSPAKENVPINGTKENENTTPK